MLIVENTQSTPQEIPEHETKKNQEEMFSFKVPLEMSGKRMMGVTGLEVRISVYKITPVYKTKKELGKDTKSDERHKK